MGMALETETRKLLGISLHSQGLKHKEEERGEGIEIEAGRLSLYGRFALKAIRPNRRGQSGRVTATLASEIGAPLMQFGR